MKGGLWTGARERNSARIFVVLDGLPYYDEISSSFELISRHMTSGIENRASLNINQKSLNQLFECSIKESDIKIPGLIWILAKI